MPTVIVRQADSRLHRTRRTQIAKIASEYRVYYKPVPTDDGGYLMDHSAMIYLMGPNDNFVTVIPYHQDDASALVKLRGLIAMKPTS